MCDLSLFNTYVTKESFRIRLEKAEFLFTFIIVITKQMFSL